MAHKLPFPDRFYAAVGFAANPPLGSRAVSDETRLLLYALYQQVTAGPCDTPKPFWNALERAKWNSWNSLGSLGKLDAMRMYVSGIEDENPDWYDLVTNDGDEERVAEVAESAAEAVAAAGMDAKAQLARLNDPPDTTQAETKEPKGGTTPTPPRRKSSLTALHTQGGSPRPSTDRLTPSASRSSLSAHREPPLDPHVAKIPCLEDGTWTDVTYAAGGTKPRGRSDHASVCIGCEVWTVGGVARGRRVGDVCLFDTVKMEWIEVATKMKPGEVEIAHLTTWPARSGHAACAWGSKVLVIGGHGVDDAVDAKCEVWVLETTTREWSRVKLDGDAPRARGGHSATLVEGKGTPGRKDGRVVVFGGEDRRGRLLDDARVIDLDKMRWMDGSNGSIPGSVDEEKPKRVSKRGTKAPTWPAARSGHVACCFGDGSPDVYVFGGIRAGAAGEPTDETWCLNSMTMTWHLLNPAGVTPAPRTNAAGCVVDTTTWLIVGGGGLDGGRRDTVGLRLVNSTKGVASGLEWFACGEVQRGSALAAEGMSVVRVGGSNPGHCGALIAFGGYDGRRYSNGVHAMRRPGRAGNNVISENASNPKSLEGMSRSQNTPNGTRSNGVVTSSNTLSRTSTDGGELGQLRRENESVRDALRRANEQLAELGIAPVDVGSTPGESSTQKNPAGPRRRGLWAFISGGDADDVDSGYDSDGGKR